MEWSWWSAGLVVLLARIQTTSSSLYSISDTLTLAPFTPVNLKCKSELLTEALTHPDLIIYWVTPTNQVVVQGDRVVNSTVYESCITRRGSLYISDPQHYQVLEGNGSLSIDAFGWADRGIYECLVLDQTADYGPEANSSSSRWPRQTAYNETSGSLKTYLSLEYNYRYHVYYWSLLCGVCTATGFLLLTLLCKLVYFILET